MKRALLIAAVLAVAPGLAWAQSEQTAQRTSTFIGPVAGTQEVTLSGTGSSDRHFDDGTFGATGSYGWYFNPNVELGVRQSLNWSNSGDTNQVNGSTRLALDYNFNLGRLRPFIGINIGAVYGHGVADTGIAGPEAGLKFFVNDTTFVVAQAEYQYFFNDSDEVVDQFDDGSIAYSLGLGFTF